jgi:tetratricopeptide (TPR) repeat protein
LERVTTASLPALKKYVEGMYHIEALGDNDRAGRCCTKPSRWTRLCDGLATHRGIVVDLRPTRRAAQMAAIEKAYRYRDRLSDNERLTTEAGYYSFGPDPDLERSAAAYEALLERDSTSSPALNNGGLRYAQMRNYARAEELLRRATAIPQPFGGAFTNLVALQVAMGKLSAAESTQAALRSRLPSNTVRWYSDALIAVGRSDLARSDSIARAAFADPKAASSREFSANQLKQSAQVRGRIRDALNWLGETAELQTGDAQDAPASATCRSRFSVPASVLRG